MPALKIITNLPKNKIPKDFGEKIVPILAKSVGKDEKKFIVTITGDDPIMMFGDSQSPAAVGTLESIGNLGPNENKTIIKCLSDFVNKELGVKPERFFLSFYDIKAHNIGVAGTTVDVLGP